MKSIRTFKTSQQITAGAVFVKVFLANPGVVVGTRVSLVSSENNKHEAEVSYIERSKGAVYFNLI